MKVLYSLGESGKNFGEIGKRPKSKRTKFCLFGAGGVTAKSLRNCWQLMAS